MGVQRYELFGGIAHENHASFCQLIWNIQESTSRVVESTHIKNIFTYTSRTNSDQRHEQMSK